MIELYTLTPDRLNLNGDQANLFVLAKRITWQGEQVTVVNIDTLEDLTAFGSAASKSPKRKLFFIGHGSTSAMKSLEHFAQPVRELVANLKKLSIPVIAVGSGYELLAPGAQRTERRSDFHVATLDGMSVLGYRNTDADLPEITRDGSVLLTLLHGPLLAKNPRLADQILIQLGLTVKGNDRTEEVDAIVAKAWELEAG